MELNVTALPMSPVLPYDSVVLNTFFLQLW